MKNKQTPKENALHRASGFYLCDVDDVDDEGKEIRSTPVDEYKKLKEAQKAGHGEQPSINFAAVWEEVQYNCVNSIVEMVENLRDEFLQFLKQYSK